MLTHKRSPEGATDPVAEMVTPILWGSGFHSRSAGTDNEANSFCEKLN